MMKSICAACVLLLVYSNTGVAADKPDGNKGKGNSSMVQGSSGIDKQKNKGRPDNPGEHGRENAAAKQRENPGNGSKGDESWEDAIRGARDDDERGDRDRNEDRDDNQDRDKNKDKNKKKSKDKEKQETDDD